MKSNEKLSHQEVMTGLTQCFRELISTDVTHRNMPQIINRGKAVAQIVTAAHREEIMEMKRKNAQMKLLKSERPALEGKKKVS